MCQSFEDTNDARNFIFITPPHKKMKNLIYNKTDHKTHFTLGTKRFVGAWGSVVVKALRY